MGVFYVNKQPFYHRAVILFTATRSIGNEELTKILHDAFQYYENYAHYGIQTTGIILDTIDIEECDSEAGDLQDLV